MKTYKKAVQLKYILRCSKCKSLLEATEEEYSDINPNMLFHCPVCETYAVAMPNDVHKVVIYDDGTSETLEGD